jgi:hypothetical protein
MIVAYCLIAAGGLLSLLGFVAIALSRNALHADASI